MTGNGIVDVNNSMFVLFGIVFFYVYLKMIHFEPKMFPVIYYAVDLCNKSYRIVVS